MAVEFDHHKAGCLSRINALQQQATQDEILARAKNEHLNILHSLLRIERGV